MIQFNGEVDLYRRSYCLQFTKPNTSHTHSHHCNHHAHHIASATTTNATADLLFHNIYHMLHNCHLPEYPGLQRHSPDATSQFPPGLHLQLPVQSTPKNPGAHRRLQVAPMNPGGQMQRPSKGSQMLRSEQVQDRWQFIPNLPDSHPGLKESYAFVVILCWNPCNRNKRACHIWQYTLWQKLDKRVKSSSFMKYIWYGCKKVPLFQFLCAYALEKISKIQCHCCIASVFSFSQSFHFS